MNPLALSIFISSLGLGTIISLSSFHWILAWVGLEINTLAIIPLMTKMPHPRAIEASTKYFLIQAAASALILFSSSINAWLTGQWMISIDLNFSSTIMLTIAIAMKLGIAPFHFWFPEVLQGLPLLTGLILSTWQKLAPLALILQFSQSVNLNLLLIFGATSMFMGGWGGINQTQIRKILAFSSTAHLGWTMVVLKFSPSLALLNFTIYILMTTTLFLTFTSLNTTNMMQLSTSWTKTPTLSVLSLLSLLSLSGLPPMTGFMPKWLIAQELIKQDLFFFTLTILMSTLLSLFFYLRLTYTMSLTLAPNTTISSSSWLFNKTNTLSPLLIFSLLLLPTLPLTLSLF